MTECHPSDTSILIATKKKPYLHEQAEVVFVSISFFQSLSRQKESYHLKVLYKIYL